MATTKIVKSAQRVDQITHTEARRKNIPTVEHQSVMLQHEHAPVQVEYSRASKGLDEEKKHRNRDLDPQLVWRGKDQQDWSDLIVNAPPLYIQEKVKPKVLIDDLLRISEAGTDRSDTLDLFGDFNGLPEGADRTEFYQHEGHWQNRMILGDSLQVMASLAEREGLRGKVQCIYFDPPTASSSTATSSGRPPAAMSRTGMQRTSLVNRSRSRHFGILGAMGFTHI